MVRLPWLPLVLLTTSKTSMRKDVFHYCQAQGKR